MKFNILRNRNFLFLMIGKLISGMGTDMQNFALSLYVLKDTGSATKFASVLVVSLIVKLIFGPIGGVVADWLDKKKILVFLDIICGLIIAAFATIYSIHGRLDLYLIYILVILLSLVGVVFNNASTSVIPSIIKEDDLVDANSVNSLILSLGSLISPIIASLLFGIYSIIIILILNSISFFISALTEMLLELPKINNNSKQYNMKSFKNDFVEGILYIKNEKLILNVIIVAIIVNFAFTPIFSIGYPYILKQLLKVTDYRYGIIQTVLIAGTLIGPIVCTFIIKKIDLNMIIYLQLLIISILILGIAIASSPIYIRLFDTNLIPSITLAIVGFLIAIISAIGNIALGTVFQKTIPLSMFGRVGAVMNTGVMASVPIGQLIYGLLFDKTEVYICAIISSILIFLGSIIFKALSHSKSNNKIENYSIINSNTSENNA